MDRGRGFARTQGGISCYVGLQQCWTCTQSPCQQHAQHMWTRQVAAGHDSWQWARAGLLAANGVVGSGVRWLFLNFLIGRARSGDCGTAC
jgi:hypothetical protein